MGLVILMMVFHIINSLRAKQLGEALFDTNGVAGLVFYGAVAAVVVLYMTGKCPSGRNRACCDVRGAASGDCLQGAADEQAEQKEGAD